jgi:hypothetical protein
MLKKLTIVSVALLIGAGVAWAASDTFSVLMTVRQPISVTNTAALNFGTVEAGAGVQTVNANAGPHSAGVTAQAATFDLTGEATAVANVTLAATTIITDGTNNLTVTLTPQSATHTFSAGTDVFYVGGSVDVTAAVAGSYTGSETLTLIYQ